MTTTTIAPIMHTSCPNCTALIDIPEPAMRTNEYYCDVCGWASGDDAPTPTATREPAATIDEVSLMINDIRHLNAELADLLCDWLAGARCADDFYVNEPFMVGEIAALINRIHEVEFHRDTETFAPDLIEAQS